MHRYKELKVWQKSMDLAEQIYQMTKDFPKEEKYGLTSQLRKCAMSIPSNIAEGAGRNTDKDFSRFLDVSVGSLFELETQILLSARVGFLSEEHRNQITDEVSQIHAMLIGLKKTLNK
ncbi:MAG: four helix bundle protein [Cyclobacteriaceae bacterium]